MKNPHVGGCGPDASAAVVVPRQLGLVRHRRRSEFIRAAIRQALWQHQERATAAAYAREPDTDAAYFDAREWSPEWNPDPESDRDRGKPRRRLQRIGTLPPSREAEVKGALGHALAWPELMQLG